MTVTMTVTVTVIRFDKASQVPYSRFLLLRLGTRRAWPGGGRADELLRKISQVDQMSCTRIATKHADLAISASAADCVACRPRRPHATRLIPGVLFTSNVGHGHVLCSTCCTVLMWQYPMYCEVDCQAVRQAVGFQILYRMCSFCNLVHELLRSVASKPCCR